MLDAWDDFLINEEGSDPYIPPRPTKDYIQLRFTLARFCVYRVVQLPVTFTFANLHTLIQYMFGWSDSHLHQAQVFDNVVLYTRKTLQGTIKSCGRKRPLEDYEIGDRWAVDHWKRFEQANRPIYRVQPRVKNRKDRIDNIMLMEEKGLMLESIWSQNEKQNVSDGQCTNAQIGIIYTYDLGDEWNVHIICEQGNVFHHLETPGSLPIFKDAQGAPPIEHVTVDDPMEEDAEDKVVSPRLFDVSYFEGYCQGKIVSVARKSELDILTLEEEEERRNEYMQMKKERAERIASGEYDEDDEYEDGEDEYDE